VNPQGVVADKLHIGDGNVGRDSLRVKNSHARVLINAGGAVAMSAQIEKRVVARVLRVPSDSQQALVTEGFQILGEGRHRNSGLGARNAE
jgi:hypothetical protein